MKNPTTRKLLAMAVGLLSTPCMAATSQLSIQRLESSSFRLDWVGEFEVNYFIQWSLNLQDWSYFPVIEQGVDHDYFNFNSDAPRFFTRLRLWTDSTSDPYSADFDGDGLSNIFELMFGLDPLDTDSDNDNILDGVEDEDADGSLNSSEMTAGRDPSVKDHPAVKLGVIVAE